MIGEPCYTVVMLDWDDMAALEAALGSEIGQRIAADAMANLARYAIFRGMICNSKRSDRPGQLEGGPRWRHGRPSAYVRGLRNTAPYSATR